MVSQCAWNPTLHLYVYLMVTAFTDLTHKPFCFYCYAFVPVMATAFRVLPSIFLVNFHFHLSFNHCSKKRFCQWTLIYFLYSHSHAYHLLWHVLKMFCVMLCLLYYTNNLRSTFLKEIS
jgi:hypothetical protein